MTDFADFKAQIRDWANRGDWDDNLTTSYIRMAEQKFNQDLRIDRMIKSSEITSTNRCAILPDDWLSMNLVSISSPNAANGWLPIRYKSNDEMFNLTDRSAYLYYTIVGRAISFGGTPVPVDGTRFQIFYYGEVPVFSDTIPSWVYTKYPNLYLFAGLMHANLHAVGEENQALALKAQVDDAIGKLNAQHLFARASGSRITRTMTRSFG
jgi:hypothetical protein